MSSISIREYRPGGRTRGHPLDDDPAVSDLHAVHRRAPCRRFDERRARERGSFEPLLMNPVKALPGAAGKRQATIVFSFALMAPRESSPSGSCRTSSRRIARPDRAAGRLAPVAVVSLPADRVPRGGDAIIGSRRSPAARRRRPIRGCCRWFPVSPAWCWRWPGRRAAAARLIPTFGQTLLMGQLVRQAVSSRVFVGITAWRRR